MIERLARDLRGPLLKLGQALKLCSGLLHNCSVATSSFQIYYKLGTEQPEYVPDFVAEIDAVIFMLETKARKDLKTDEVKAKAAAALQWCRHASDYAVRVGGKPWKYLLVPHDEVNESRQLTDFLRSEVKG
ncbi:hypothetical protein HHS34_000150 [Acidithiobacillus montserratensis]|uniref:Uncharacterized protein n=1 Tax=Acidithiobacillus montserratensis TaxID=2729135 RepID=A0ACD5HFV1_9PROT|nr:hypothetical protein [Acidithiobacillus montserratensis]